uniref:CCHC-type domain-containing protein n=1 Tax=Soboliphyme baturini TaxID=241478 RepID=A0A183IR35_9BILA
LVLWLDIVRRISQLFLDIRKKSTVERAEVKDLNIYDRSRKDVEDVVVEIHNGEPEPNSPQTFRNHGATNELVNMLQDEISRLRSQLATVTKSLGDVHDEEYVHKAASPVSGYGSCNESEVRRLKEKKIKSMKAEMDNLQEQLSSKSTNLLRCEDKLRKVQQEKNRISAELSDVLRTAKRRNTEADHSDARFEPSSPSPHIVRSKSDNVLTTPRTKERDEELTKHSSLASKQRRSLSSSPERRAGNVNRYCNVCRLYRNGLLSHYQRRGHRGSVIKDSKLLSFAAKGRNLDDASEAVVDKLIEENLSLWDMCRKAKADYDSLQQEHEVLRNSYNQVNMLFNCFLLPMFAASRVLFSFKLKHQNIALGKEQRQTPSAEKILMTKKNTEQGTHTPPATSDQLVDHYKSLLAKSDAEKSRHEANYALVSGQKVKITLRKIVQHLFLTLQNGKRFETEYQIENLVAFSMVILIAAHIDQSYHSLNENVQS